MAMPDMERCNKSESLIWLHACNAELLSEMGGQGKNDVSRTWPEAMSDSKAENQEHQGVPGA